MTADTRTTRPGALALLALERKAPEQVSALADLRALLARCEAAERERDALAEALERIAGEAVSRNTHWASAVADNTLAAYRAERGK